MEPLERLLVGLDLGAYPTLIVCGNATFPLPQIM